MKHRASGSLGVVLPPKPHGAPWTAVAAGKDPQLPSHDAVSLALLALDFDLIAIELSHARKKHPHFIDAFSRMTPEGAARMLQAHRDFVADFTAKGTVDFNDIIDCEVAEALDAYARGDLSETLHELAQVAAVAIRGMQWIRDAIAKGEEPIPF